MNRTFDLKRMYFVIRKDFFSYWRTALVVSSAIVAVLIVAGFFNGLVRTSGGVDYRSFFGATAVIWGCIAASMAFSELHNKSLNEDFLMLPASSFEKTLSRLLFVSVALPVLILVVVLFGSTVSELLTLLVFRTEFQPLNPFQRDIWFLLGALVIIQSIFFLGASWFKKAHLVKTVLSLFVLFIAFAIVGSVAFRLLFSTVFGDFTHPRNFGIDLGLIMESRYPQLFRTMQIIGKILFYGMLAPFCWLVAYFRVEETQSSDGV